MTLHEKLVAIQTDISVPKGQWNRFSEFYYRSCEDILTAVTPYLKKHNVTLVISDDIINVVDRFYVKATATISDGATSISSTGFARESLEKKGMDSAQLTGSTSSYARKYALAGLLLLDDVKDADDNSNYEKKETPQTRPDPALPVNKPALSKGKPMSVSQKSFIEKICKNKNLEIPNITTSEEASLWINKNK